MRGRIALCALVVGVLGYAVHRLALVVPAWLLGNDDMIVGLDCCLDYHRDAPDPWANVLIGLSGVIVTQVVALTAIGMLAARRGPVWALPTVAVTLFLVSPLLQLIVYLAWHRAERDYVAVIDYSMDATGLPEQPLVVLFAALFIAYTIFFGAALGRARQRAFTAAPR
ncbi:MAG TPA: hypothetical protein VFV66_32345 [Nonomuraea sp.]|nr:hypothetical protein [Nonomuraea sp.]